MSETSSADAGGFEPGKLRTAPTRMRRSRDDRYIAGVCGGLARYLNVDPVVVRVIVAALTVVGGVGIVLYGAAWLLAPEEGSDQSMLESHLPASPRVRVLGWIVAGVIAAIAVIGSGPWFDWGWIGPFPLIGLIVLIWVLARPRSSGSSEPAASTAPATPPVGSTATAPGPPPPPPADSTTSDAASSGTDPATTAMLPAREDDDQTTRLPMVPPSSTPAVVPPTEQSSAPPPPPPPAPTPAGPPPSPPTPKRRFDPTLTLLTLATLVVATGLLWLIDQTTTDVNGPVYLATGIAVVGAGILVGTWWGNGRALIPLGAVLTVVLIAVSQLPVWRFGEINEAPTNAADVRSSYQMGAGQIRLDLTRVTDLQALDGETIHLETGLGQTRVIVPRDLDVTVYAQLNAGDVRVFDREANGADASTQYTDPDDLDPNLTIDIDGSLGQIEVTRA
jgi:phage shock protein PspC (stress-responsive transcriptional regulator)